MTDVDIRHRPADGSPRRVRFEPRPSDGHWRITEEWHGRTRGWRETGREAVTDAVLETSDDEQRLSDYDIMENTYHE